MFTVAKFLRTNSGFINKNDYKAVDELSEHMDTYLLYDPYLLSNVHKLYEKRQKELNELDKKEMMFVELLTEEMPSSRLKQAEVSEKEWN